MGFNVTACAKVEFIHLVPTLCTLHILPAINKLDITTTNSFAAASVSKDEFRKILATNLVAGSVWLVKLEKVVNLLSTGRHSTPD